MFDALRDKDDDASDKADGSSGYGSIDEPTTSSASSPFKTPIPPPAPVKVTGRTGHIMTLSTAKRSLFSDKKSKAHPATSASKKKSPDDELTPRALRALKREGMMLRSSKMLDFNGRTGMKRTRRSSTSSSASTDSVLSTGSMKLRNGTYVGERKTAKKEKVRHCAYYWKL